MKTKLSYTKFAGVISIVALIAASVAPDTFRIPGSLRPWIFIFAVAWSLLITSGVFS